MEKGDSHTFRVRSVFRSSERRKRWLSPFPAAFRRIRRASPEKGDSHRFGWGPVFASSRPETVAVPLSEMRGRLEGRAALVTGAAQGVGKGIALELARAGCHVALNDIAAADVIQRTASEVAALGVQTFAVSADIRSGTEVMQMIGRVVDRFGRLDTLVNNAGVQIWKPLLEVTEDEWDLVVETNLKGCFLCTQAAARHMKDHSGGCIVNIGSGSNKVAFRNLVAYTASKGGIEQFTKVAAVELGPHRIRVNCVAPGAIEIERTRLERPDYAEAWGGLTPLRRVGTPQDVGRAVVMLASDDAAFITGQTIWVDGGLFSQPPWPPEPRRDPRTRS